MRFANYRLNKVSMTRQNAIGSLKFDASSEKFDASQHGQSEAIFYFFLIK